MTDDIQDWKDAAGEAQGSNPEEHPEYSLERLTDSAFILIGSIEEDLSRHARYRMRARRWGDALKVIVHVEQLVGELRKRVTALRDQFGES